MRKTVLGFVGWSTNLVQTEIYITIGLTVITCGTDIHGTPDFSSSATVRLVSLVQSKMSLQILDGLP